MVEIGAGGGSIARVDALKRITVGPESAGAEPGPACYGRGGTAPTVTDADVVLGRIDPDALRRRHASRSTPTRPSGAVERDVGDAARPRRRATPPSASARSSTRTWPTPRASMRSSAARTLRRPHPDRLRRRGAAACRAAGREARHRPRAWCRRMPASARRSASCARRSPTRWCAAATCGSTQFDAGAVNALLAEMRAEAEARGRAGAPARRLIERRTAYMRYRRPGPRDHRRPAGRATFDGGDRATTLREPSRTATPRLFGRAIPGARDRDH